MSGFGKTSSVLTGAILAAEEDGMRIIYACRTKRQVARVMDEISKIQKRMPVNATQLFAKSDYCLLKEGAGMNVSQESFKWYCSFNTTNNLCSYFLNLNLVGRKVGEILKELGTRAMTHTELLERCRETHVCPYEVLRLAMADSRIIITTYHYLLNEVSRSLLFSTTGWSKSETVTIIDEAHNLRDFLRDANTEQFSFADLDRARRDAKDLYLRNAELFLEELERSLRSFCSENKSWFVDRAALLRHIQKSHDDVWLPNLALELSTCAGIGWQTISMGRNMPTSIMKVGSFLRDLLVSDDGRSLVKSEDSFFLVKTGPTHELRNLTAEYASLILLSATINPSDLFLRSVGLPGDTTLHRIITNQKFNVLTLIDTGTSTRFKTRDASMYSKIASKIGAVCKSTQGNVGIFVPSYAMLDSLKPFLSDTLRNRVIIAEGRNMSNKEAESVINTFKSSRGSLLLAVQGARFSEGEDFPGEQMDVSIVVGLSLAPPSPTTYAQFAASDLNRHDTYLMVSLLPAVRKAIQSAGRHIRSPEKKGLVLFMDSRFAQPTFKRMLPGWLQADIRVGDFQISEMERVVEGFFS